MAGEIGPFDFTRKLMKAAGMIGADGPYRWLYLGCQALFFSTLAYTWVSLVVRICGGSEAASVTLMEAVLYAVGMLHITCKLVVLKIRGPRILAMTVHVERLTGENSKRATRIAQLVPQVYLAVCSATLVVALPASLYTGRPPYPALWTPLTDIRSVCILQTASLFVPTAYLAVPYGILTGLTVHLSAHISTLCRRLRSLDKSPNVKADLSSCVALHIQIMRLVNEMNSTFGDLLFQEILLSSVQCCLSAFLCSQQMKLLAKGNNVFCFDFAITTLMPLIICSCGERLKDMSSRISLAAYSSKWYSQSYGDKKTVRVLMTAANRHMKLHYKNLFNFDFVQYSLVLQTAYSYFTVLQSLELV